MGGPFWTAKCRLEYEKKGVCKDPCILEEDKGYFLFYKFYEELKRNEWRMDENETKTMVTDVFKADSKQKRIGRGNAIRCMEVDMKQFEEDEPPEEILEFDKEEDIV